MAESCQLLGVKFGCIPNIPNTQSNRYFSQVVNSNHAASPSFEYVWDNAAVTSGGANQLITGAWRPITTTDFSSNINVTGSGLAVSINNVGITGGYVGVTGTVNSSITNPAFLITGNPQVQVSNFNSSVAITGSPTFTLSSGGGPIYITGVGFSPTFQTITSGQFLVPIGARSYSFSVISGNGYINGSLIVQGLSFNGGGYSFSTLTSPIAIGITGGMIFASYE